MADGSTWILTVVIDMCMLCVRALNDKNKKKNRKPPFFTQFSTSTESGLPDSRYGFYRRLPLGHLYDQYANHIKPKL